MNNDEKLYIEKIFKKLIKTDVELTHYEKLTQHCNILYAMALAFLLNNPDAPNKGKLAFDFAFYHSNTVIANY